MLRRLSIYGVGLWLVGLLGPVQAFEATMQVRPDAVRMGESAELLITVQGVDRPGEPQLPSIPGLRFGAPRVEQSFSMTMINGRMQETRSVNFRYAIIPTQPGEYSIGPFLYSYRGNQVELPAQSLRVVMPDGGAGQVRDLSELVFARLEVSRNRIYIHEPLRFTIAIYARDVNLGRDVSLSNMPDTGIQMQPFQELRATREVYQNDVYEVRRYVTEIRPLTAGILRFEPGMRVQLLVPRSEQRRRGMFDDPFFGGLFTNMEAHPFDLEIEPVEVVVQALPEVGRPPSFTGGVGQFDLQVRVSPSEIRAGDPVTVTVVIEGEGNMDAVSAPIIPESDLFRTYPTRITNQDLDRALTRGRKIYEQVIIPRSAEITAVPALAFSFFDPRTESYRTIERGPFPLTIQEGDTLAARVVRGDAETMNGVRARVLGQDIQYLKPAPKRWRSADQLDWFRRPIFLGLQVFPPLMVLGAWWLTRRQRALDADVAKARRYRAPGSAREGMRAAEKAITAADEEAFFGGLWQALTGYFGNRLNLAPGEVTAPDVRQAMVKAGLDAATLSDVERLFAACDQRRYAGTKASAEEMKQLLDVFRGVLKVCEKLKSPARELRGQMGAVVLLISLALSGHAQADDRFRQAADAYDREDFANAVQLYEELVAAGYRVPELFHNLGNAYYRVGDIGRSVLNYRRALWLAPRSAESRHNAGFVMREGDAMAGSVGYWPRLLRQLRWSEWIGWAVGLWWLAAIALILRIRSGARVDPALGTVAVGLAIALLGVWDGWRLHMRPEVVVLQPNQEALFAPLDGSTAHFALPPGSVARLDAEMDGWYRIQIDKKIGWIRNAAVDRVPLSRKGPKQ